MRAYDLKAPILWDENMINMVTSAADWAVRATFVGDITRMC